MMIASAPIAAKARMTASLSCSGSAQAQMRKRAGKQIDPLTRQCRPMSRQCCQAFDGRQHASQRSIAADASELGPDAPSVWEPFETIERRAPAHGALRG